MVSFRKIVMAMVLLVIVAGAALAALSPPVVQPIVSCAPYNQQTARLRSEGVTELIPALTFQCVIARQLPNMLTGDVVSSGTLYDWFVYFPAIAPLTSSPSGVPGGPTEPQLYVEVVPQDVPGGPEASEGVSSAFWASAITPGNGASGGSVEFDKVNMNPNGDSDTDPSVKFDNVYITIVNLRVDALGLASTGPLVTPNALTLTIFAQPSYTTVGNNQQNPGNIFVPPGAAPAPTSNMIQMYTANVGVGYSAPSLVVTANGSLTWQQCYDYRRHERDQTDGTTGASDTKHLYFHVDFTELYSYAFAPPTDGWEQDGGVAYPNGGIRLFFTFANDGENAWPPFVQLDVPDGIEVLDGSTVVVRAVLVKDPNPDGSGGTLYPTPSSWHSWHMSNPGGMWGGNWEMVDTSTGGSNMVVYQILATPPAWAAVITTLEVPVRGSIIDVPTVYPIPDGTDDMIGIIYAGYAPWTPASVPQTDPIPRFHGPAPFAGGPLLVINPCTTNLLFPYLVAGQGWDTGVAVANSGMDPFGQFYPDSHGGYAVTPAVPGTSANGNQQPGVCYFYFYGSFGRGAPLVTEAINPPNPIILGAAGFNGSPTGDAATDYIQPGTTSEDLIAAVLHQVYTVWDETKDGTWNGYAIAQCDFLYAHGYAFAIFQSTKQTGAVSLGYLALVLNQRGLNSQSQAPELVTF